MPWMMKASTIVCVLAVFLLPQSATSDPQAGPPAHYPFTHAQYGCAPTDALALDFYFTAEKSECGKYTEAFVKISIWKDLPKSAPYSIEMRGTQAGAIRCVRAGACEAATSGSLHLGRFINDKSSAGSYELHFKGGSVEKGKFDATWCHLKFVCG